MFVLKGGGIKKSEKTGTNTRSQYFRIANAFQNLKAFVSLLQTEWLASFGLCKNFLSTVNWNKYADEVTNLILTDFHW